MENIYIYSECSNMAGRRCFKDVEGRDDVREHPVSVDEYKRLRRLSRIAGAGRDLFLRRSARAVMEALR